MVALLSVTCHPRCFVVPEREEFSTWWVTPPNDGSQSSPTHLLDRGTPSTGPGSSLSCVLMAHVAPGTGRTLGTHVGSELME